MIKVAILKTKGRSGLSVLDVDGWRRILVSNIYGIRVALIGEEHLQML